MFRATPPPGVRSALLALILLFPNTRIRQGVELAYDTLAGTRPMRGETASYKALPGDGKASQKDEKASQKDGKASQKGAKAIVSVHIRGLDGTCRQRVNHEFPILSHVFGGDSFCGMHPAYVWACLRRFSVDAGFPVSQKLLAEGDEHTMGPDAVQVLTNLAPTLALFVSHDSGEFVRSRYSVAGVKLDLKNLAQSMSEFVTRPPPADAARDGWRCAEDGHLWLLACCVVAGGGFAVLTRGHGPWTRGHGPCRSVPWGSCRVFLALGPVLLCTAYECVVMFRDAAPPGAFVCVFVFVCVCVCVCVWHIAVPFSWRPWGMCVVGCGWAGGILPSYLSGALFGP